MQKAECSGQWKIESLMFFCLLLTTYYLLPTLIVYALPFSSQAIHGFFREDVLWPGVPEDCGCG